MMGETVASISFCFASYSSFSEVWWASSHAMPSSHVVVRVALSSSEILPSSFGSLAALRTP